MTLAGLKMVSKRLYSLKLPMFLLLLLLASLWMRRQQVSETRVERNPAASEVMQVLAGDALLVADAKGVRRQVHLARVVLPQQQRWRDRAQKRLTERLQQLGNQVYLDGEQTVLVHSLSGELLQQTLVEAGFLLADPTTAKACPAWETISLVEQRARQQQVGVLGTNVNTTKTITVSGSPSGRYVRILRDQTTSVSSEAAITLAEIAVQGVTASCTRCLRAGGAKCRGDASAQNEMPNGMIVKDTKREI